MIEVHFVKLAGVVMFINEVGNGDFDPTNYWWFWVATLAFWGVIIMLLLHSIKKIDKKLLAEQEEEKIQKLQKARQASKRTIRFILIMLTLGVIMKLFVY